MVKDLLSSSLLETKDRRPAEPPALLPGPGPDRDAERVWEQRIRQELISPPRKLVRQLIQYVLAELNHGDLRHNA